MTSRHELLKRLHALLQPRGYLEIGVFTGTSLTLSRSPSVAVDPVSRVSETIHCDVEFVNETSDDFFAQPQPLSHLPEGRLDFCFIDGMHLFEFVLRDFMNVERLSHPGTVVILDDIFPRNVDEAARNRHTQDWTGDVFKIVSVLKEYRPDLIRLPMDTTPTGTMILLGLDSTNHVLSDTYDEITARFITVDPQIVPSEVLNRANALPPERVLASDFWTWFVESRDGLQSRADTHRDVTRRAIADFAR